VFDVDYSISHKSSQKRIVFPPNVKCFIIMWLNNYIVILINCLVLYEREKEEYVLNL